MRPVPFSDLTPEQQAFVALPTSRHAAAVGAPGSGKTLVLVHRAMRLIEFHGADPSRILIVTYTNALEAYIRAGLVEWGLPESMVISYDALMRRLHQELEGRSYPRKDNGNDDEHFNGQRDAVNRLLKVEPEISLLPAGPRWDAVLADEAQDLGAQDIETLAMIGRHVTVVMDGRQQLYRRGCGAAELLAALGLRWESATFLSTFRCSRSVLEVASAVALSAEDRVSLPRTVGRVVEEIPSLRVLATDRDAEDVYLHQALKARTSAGHSCVVLLPTRKYAYGLAKALNEAGFDVEGPNVKGEASVSAIKVMTYHSAKGLSFDSVFLPRLYESQLREVARHTVRGSLLFVALTRATTYLFLSSVIGKQAKEWAEFDRVDTDHLQTVHPGTSGALAGPPEPPAAFTPSLDDFI
ncbi:UvrD-helicase domain-containing protein [Nocardioides sp. NPDC057767]|uniref:UvrD-helicase domain-containing protein n=1 Tax=unclassified Nocardioides TaxID=2615069 RepID=UPI00366FA219